MLPAAGPARAPRPDPGRVARRTYETTWRQLPTRDRAAACRAVAAALRAHRAELAALECRDTGKPIGQAGTDVDIAARYFEFYAGTVEALYGATLLSEPDLAAWTVPEPHGGGCGSARVLATPTWAR